MKKQSDTPACVSNLTSTEGPYTNDQIIEILNTKEWMDTENNMYSTDNSFNK